MRRSRRGSSDDALGRRASFPASVIAERSPVSSPAQSAACEATITPRPRASDR
jgi:hypothetical protein